MGKKTGPKFYVVWQGRNPGIYESWSDCQQEVSGFPAAKFKSFGSRAEAEQAFGDQYERYVGQSTGTNSKKNKATLDPADLERRGVILDSVCVDAACCGNPGELEYQGVETVGGAKLFAEGPFDEGTVNIGEFLAIVEALVLLQAQGRDCPIYSDSRTAMAWVRRKRANTKLPKTQDNATLFFLLERAEKWLVENRYPNSILKWKTTDWGEIPADYGRK